jgi:hypothetical protein
LARGGFELEATMAWTAAWQRLRMVEEERRLTYLALAADVEVELDTADDAVAGPSTHGVTGATTAG